MKKVALCARKKIVLRTEINIALRVKYNVALGEKKESTNEVIDLASTKKCVIEIMPHVNSSIFVQNILNTQVKSRWLVKAILNICMVKVKSASMVKEAKSTQMVNCHLT